MLSEQRSWGLCPVTASPHGEAMLPGACVVTAPCPCPAYAHPLALSHVRPHSSRPPSLTWVETQSLFWS